MAPSSLSELKSHAYVGFTFFFNLFVLFFCFCLFLFRCLDCLLDSGANPTLKNSKGYSAVHYAAALGNKQHLELVSYILAKRFYLLINLIYFIYLFFSRTFAAFGDFIQLPRGD